MTSIVAYRKHIDAITTKELQLPEGENRQRIGTELATVDGITYVSLPDGATLPADQPKEIAATIEFLGAPLSDALRDSIRAASPHVRLIDQRVVAQIRDRYSVDDEIKLLRIAPSEETSAWNAYVEDCRAWGRSQKAALGL